ncbi:uncharacterized protein VP01_661g3 [Puccinia sorghi]|uniref:Uncharacterized protein n=1 Tax=Puccinia sorghi TaxID=27349 RepID=A0A0L6UF31_9BASI|nr:uncharacterized protein VP01_661g3 [Puccinia sorghi]
MAKLQFLTAHLYNQDDKKAIVTKCDMSRRIGRLTVRLFSGLIPFNMVFKLFLDGVFLTRRCFLSGNMELICDYHFAHDHLIGKLKELNNSRKTILAMNPTKREIKLDAITKFIGGAVTAHKTNPNQQLLEGIHLTLSTWTENTRRRIKHMKNRRNEQENEQEKSEDLPESVSSSNPPPKNFCPIKAI